MRASPTVTLLLLIAVVLGCAGVLLAQPRSVAPIQMPSLTLPAEPVMEALAEDARAAKRAPTTAIAKQLDAWLLERGHADQAGDQPQSERFEQGRRMGEGYKNLVKESGASAAVALRAAATERLDAALEGKLAVSKARDVIGSFALMLEREGCARDAEIVAPQFVVRTLYKARWNLMHGRPPTDAFARIEQRAFFGWQALHGERLPLDQRLQALQAYAEQGGTQVRESAAVLLFRGGQLEAAAAPLAAAYEKSGNLRLRNELRALQVPDEL